MTEKHKDWLDSIPSGTIPEISLAVPNEEIVVLEGTFKLKNDAGEMEVDGKIMYRWIPTSGTYFQGFVKNYTKGIIKTGYYEIISDEKSLGAAIVLRSIQTDVIYLEGVFRKYCATNETSIPVEEVRFIIPNMRNFDGDHIKYDMGVILGRMEFSTSNHTLTIDKYHDIKDRIENLNSLGGYHALYTGKLKFTKGLNLQEVRELMEPINYFLSFLNGRRISGMFLSGYSENEVIWQDYSDDFNDPYYKYISSWSISHITDESYGTIYSQLFKMWKKEDDRSFIKSSIGWYLEANSNSLSNTSAMIMAQTNLELLYNYLIVEKDGILQGRDAENISASNKIRLLLSKVGMKFDAPSESMELISYIKGNSTIKDAPDAIVDYRNSIVHSQKKKRQNLDKMNDNFKLEALRISLLYIEVSILHVLKYEGYYRNRCTGIYDKLPWVK